MKKEDKGTEAEVQLLEMVKEMQERGEEVVPYYRGCPHKKEGYRTKWKETGKIYFWVIGLKKGKLKARVRKEVSATFFYVEGREICQTRLFEITFSESGFEEITLEAKFISEETRTLEEMEYVDETVLIEGGDGFRLPAHRAPTGYLLEHKKTFSIKRKKFMVLNLKEEEQVRHFSSLNIEVDGDMVIVEERREVGSSPTGKRKWGRYWEIRSV